MASAREEQKDLASFREFVRNKRRNQFLRLKQTEKYSQDPERYDREFADVNDEATNGLIEKGAEPYDCRGKIYRSFVVKRSKGSGKIVRDLGVCLTLSNSS